MTGEVFLHIGLGKTGTSTIQTSLHEQRERLRSHGIEVAGHARPDTRRAVYDLMGRRIGHGDNAGVIGAFDPWAAGIAASSSRAVVCSEEMLALARPRQVRKLLAALTPRRVVVVVTVRDLGSLLTSYWQQSVMSGRKEDLETFLAAVRDPGQGPASAGVAFWLREDLPRVLDSWGRHVPIEDFRIVVVPRACDPWPLEDRFAEVIGAPRGSLRLPVRANASLGWAEVEAVRRLNTMVSLRENHRLHLMRVLRTAMQEPSATTVRLPPAERGWVEERTDAWRVVLRDRGYPVVGSLDDLTPEVHPEQGRPTTEAVLDAAVVALAALCRDHARLWARYRRHEDPVPVTGGRMASAMRAAQFRAKTRALELADHNGLVARAARTYLKVTGRAVPAKPHVQRRA